MALADAMFTCLMDWAIRAAEKAYDDGARTVDDALPIARKDFPKLPAASMETLELIFPKVFNDFASTCAEFGGSQG